VNARSATSLILGCALALGACGSSDSGGTTGTGGSSAGQGGSVGTGGHTGGGPGTGGTLATGGHTGGSGGTVGSGGALGSGGATGGHTGGSPGTGGTTPGSGGAVSGSGGGAGAGGRAATGGSSGSGGRAGAPGTGGASGSSGAGGLCAFAAGLNVAWVNFANDVPNPDLTTFNAMFKNTHDAGGRIVRWWFHTNGTVTPGYAADGTVQPIPQSHIDGVKAILNAAHNNGLGVVISLWSFDMLQGTESIPATVLQNNYNLLTTDTVRNSYVSKYLTSLVTGLKGTPGLYAYEIFNEPEGMSTTGWTMTASDPGKEVDEMYIQKTVNVFAAAIHAADPTVPVTNGAQTFDYCSNASGKSNKYADAALRAAGGQQTGTLDFYEVHYYQSNGASNSAVTYPASHWALDKRLVMGEFAAVDTDGTTKDNLFTHFYDTGYDGAWAWAYDEGNSSYQWPSMKQGLTNLYNAHTSVIGACP